MSRGSVCSGGRPGPPGSSGERSAARWCWPDSCRAGSRSGRWCSAQWCCRGPRAVGRWDRLLRIGTGRIARRGIAIRNWAGRVAGLLAGLADRVVRLRQQRRSPVDLQDTRLVDRAHHVLGMRLSLIRAMLRQLQHAVARYMAHELAEGVHILRRRDRALGLIEVALHEVDAVRDHLEADSQLLELVRVGAGGLHRGVGGSTGPHCFDVVVDARAESVDRVRGLLGESPPTVGTRVDIALLDALGHAMAVQRDPNLFVRPSFECLRREDLVRRRLMVLRIELAPLVLDDLPIGSPVIIGVVAEIGIPVVVLIRLGVRIYDDTRPGTGDDIDDALGDVERVDHQRTSCVSVFIRLPAASSVDSSLPIAAA